MTEDRPPGLVVLYQALWRHAQGARGALLAALACLLGARIVLLAMPYAAGRAMNVLQLRGAQGIGEAALWLSGILVLTLASWSLHGPGRYFERNVALRLRQRMSGELLERLVSLPLSWHEAQHSGATVHRVQQSVNALVGFAGSQYVYLSSLVALFGPLVALWVLKPVVGLAAIGGLLAISLATRGFDRRMVQHARAENDAERRFATTLLDSLGNVTTLFALRQAPAVIRLMQHRLQQVFEPVRRLIVINELKWFWVDIASRGLSCVLVGLYAWLASRPDSSGAGAPTLLLGSLYMVWEYAQQAGGVVTDIASHMQGFARLQVDYSSADGIRHSAPAPYLASTAVGVLPRWQQLRLDELQFRHASRPEARPTVDVKGLVLQRGRRYALVGASGSGKSTLLRLLAGLYAAERMQLSMDSQNTSDCIQAAQWLRASSTLIPQEAEVYEGTLAENLGLCESLYGAPPPGAYAHALQVAQTADFISASPDGLNSPIVERGANWSGGQKSRIALARGVLAARDCPLLLLDEPTASLDTVTEQRVYEALFAEFPQACLVSSVHRVHVLERFDEIIVMHEGRLVAQGTPAMLRTTSAHFRSLLAAG
ncbi:MAG: ABC transporter ATP-binding protein [Steroidobacteraceae bacterium]